MVEVGGFLVWFVSLAWVLLLVSFVGYFFSPVSLVGFVWVFFFSSMIYINSLREYCHDITTSHCLHSYQLLPSYTKPWIPSVLVLKRRRFLLKCRRITFPNAPHRLAADQDFRRRLWLKSSRMSLLASKGMAFWRFLHGFCCFLSLQDDPFYINIVGWFVPENHLRQNTEKPPSKALYAQHRGHSQK